MHMHYPEIAINQTLACSVRKLSRLCTGELRSQVIVLPGGCSNVYCYYWCKQQAYPKIVLFYYNKYFLFGRSMGGMFTLWIHK